MPRTFDIEHMSETSLGICVDAVSYHYGKRVALDNVSLRVESGHFCALLGPNGAGKSTLFALLTRLFVTPRGRIRIAGFDLAAQPRRALARLGVVFQQPTLDLDLSVRQNLRYFAALHGLAGRAAERSIDAAIDRLDIRERAAERACDLNGGHRRRTEIARALVHAPEVLLLDEPTVGLDAASRASITAQIHALCTDQTLTVLWATHLVDEVQTGDDLVVMHRGRVLRHDLAGRVAGDSPLTEVFLAMTGEPA
jgi:ABC-2 type transport system ATP-binding protein